MVAEDKKNVACLRCGVPCQVTTPGSEEARILRRTTKPGLCASCALASFIKNTVPLAGIVECQGPDVLLLPVVQEQVYRVMEAGNADASPGEIDWPRLVADWSLPHA